MTTSRFATGTITAEQCCIHDDGQRCPETATHEVEDLNGFTLHTCEQHAHQVRRDTAEAHWIQLQLRGGR